MLVLLIEGIYEVRRWDGFMQHDIHTKFHEDTQTGRLSYRPTFILFFQNKENRLIK
jgi:hypothetical protein